VFIKLLVVVVVVVLCLKLLFDVNAFAVDTQFSFDICLKCHIISILRVILRASVEFKLDFENLQTKIKLLVI
jgi:hypothetical protein